MIKRVWLGLVLAFATASAPSPAVTKQLFQQDEWLLAIRSDHFTGQTFCSLYSTKRRMRYQPGAIGFFVGRRHDTLAAWYRVDGGAPVSWHDRSAALIAAHVEIDSPLLDNVTGGWVWIPIDEVQHASFVDVRPGGSGHIRRFPITGFASLREAADRLGCNSDDAFRL